MDVLQLYLRPTTNNACIELTFIFDAVNSPSSGKVRNPSESERIKHSPKNTCIGNEISAVHRMWYMFKMLEGNDCSENVVFQLLMYHNFLQFVVLPEEATAIYRGPIFFFTLFHCALVENAAAPSSNSF